MKRKTILRAGLPLIACAAAFCASEVWNTKDPAVWTTEDANLILNNSPWAKQIKVSAGQPGQGRRMGGGGMGMVQQQIVGHGKYAFQVHGTGAGGGFATILTKSVPAALKGAGPIFGRLYLYATANYGAHIQLGIAGTNPVDPTATPAITTTAPNINFNYMEFAEFSNSWQVGFDLFTPLPSVSKGFVEEASYPPARDPYPTMKWNCIEWEFGDNPEMMLLWVDGKQIDQFDLQHISFTSTARTPGSVLNGLNSGIVGGYSVFGFGFHSYGSSAVVDRYYDDIVLDTKRVNCLP